MPRCGRGGVSEEEEGVSFTVSATGMRVAVIGCGVGGLVSLKSCKEEGIDAVCFEMSNRVGGLWSPHKPEHEVSTAYDSLITNTSKEMTAFSDHPFPEHYPTYMSRDLVHQYLLSYCERFHLMDDIKLNHKVHLVEKADDYDVTGSFLVTVEDTLDDKGKTTLKFDAVMLCTGVHSYPNIPKIPNMDKFKGTISHSHFYTNYKDISGDEKVVVVGNYSSGLDVATDLANREGEPVFLSARSPVAVFTRNYSKPVDMTWSLFLSDFTERFPKLYDLILLRKFRKINASLERFEKWLPIKKRCWIAVNDDIRSCIESGRVKSVAALSEFTEDGVKLTDGEIIDVDRVILATGYKVCVPIVNTDLLDPNSWCAYKNVWPVNMTKNSLALIGYGRVFGVAPPVLELQARWAVQVFKGKCKLPTTQTMKAVTPVRRDTDKMSLVNQLALPFVSYCAEIASYIGCYPGLGYFLKNPLRWFRVYFGPAYPYVYRLVGPGSSPDAWRLTHSAPSRIHSS